MSNFSQLQKDFCQLAEESVANESLSFTRLFVLKFNFDPLHSYLVEGSLHITGFLYSGEELFPKMKPSLVFNNLSMFSSYLKLFYEKIRNVHEYLPYSAWKSPNLQVNSIDWSCLFSCTSRLWPVWRVVKITPILARKIHTVTAFLFLTATILSPQSRCCPGSKSSISLAIFCFIGASFTQLQLFLLLIFDEWCTR